jgi:hypothetical protein
MQARLRQSARLKAAIANIAVSAPTIDAKIKIFETRRAPWINGAFPFHISVAKWLLRNKGGG